MSGRRRSLTDALLWLGLLQLLRVTLCLHDPDVDTDRQPRILNQEGEEYITDSQSSFNRTCIGEEPITWSFDRTYIDETGNLSFSTISVENLHLGDTYYSELKIENASYVDTAFYYCHAIGSPRNDEHRSTHLYLYVRDEVHLSARSAYHEEDVTPIKAAVNSTVYIPCRPTSPDVDVKLFQGDVNVQIYMHQDHDSLFFAYDKRRGFRMTDNKAIDQTLLLRCKFERDGREEMKMMLVMLSPMRTYIPMPTIEDLNHGHTIVGQTLRLRCDYSMEESIHELTWPAEPSEFQRSSTNDKVLSNTLSIENVQKSDERNYSCRAKEHNVSNSNTYLPKIYDIGEHFIKLRESAGIYNVSVDGGENVTLRIDIKAHPIPKEVIWFDNQGKEVIDPRKYDISKSLTESVITIKDVSINDFGNYTLKVSNEFGEESIQLSLTVIVKPTVQIKAGQFQSIYRDNQFQCVSAGYPEPKIKWEFKACFDCARKFTVMNASHVSKKGLQVISTLLVQSKDNGMVRCTAENIVGTHYETVKYNATDVENGFNVWADDDVGTTTQLILSYGENTVLNCASSNTTFSEQLYWYRESVLITDDLDNRFTLKRAYTMYSNRISLDIINLTSGDSANYTCHGVALYNSKNPKMTIHLKVVPPEKPHIIDSNMNSSTLVMRIPNPLLLYCNASGRPRPTMTWFKDSVELDNIMTDRRSFNEDKSTLNITSTIDSDEGTYTCRASNREGSSSETASVNFENKISSRTVLVIVGLIIIISIILILAGFFYCQFRKQKKINKTLQECGLKNFEKGELECMNPELGIDDQAELLPYNKNKWEFSRSHLKLGKQLGSGAFGVVLKADANGIVKEGTVTPVAVKMVKKNTEYSYIRALASELKIMSHLGQHLNVVNLLGACTDNVAKRELLVIVEYCRYGNLHNFLLRHRNCFIDQIDKKTGQINYSIGQDILDRTYSVSSYKSQLSGSPPPSIEYQQNYSGQTMCTDSTTVCLTPTEEGVNSNMQPDWRSNYKGDYRDEIKVVSTKDLIIWSFQVARGMDYLASRKVMHGDLAARNILLAENNVVKICDFGLAKSMYKDDNYRKTGEGPLPIKWMAVESIRDRIFSTQSDVWSFGIVLWELFSLAKTPYPGMAADENLYRFLMNGKRMDCPQFATTDIYNIMLDCWHADPLCRPSFEKLGSKFGVLLDQSVIQHYIDLNDPYLKINTQRIVNGESDYLAMLSPPDFINLSSPRYVNGDICPTSSDGYLMMRQEGGIFSPRVVNSATDTGTGGTIFVFDPAKAPALTSEAGSSIELKPMLRPEAVSPEGSESDTEATATTSGVPQSPDSCVAGNSFSNPSYTIAPVIKNHSAAVIGDEREPQYQNSSSRDWERYAHKPKVVGTADA